MTDKVKLQLEGLNGNAFNLLVHFQRAERRQGWLSDEVQAVIDETTKADYYHLLATLLDNTESPASEGGQV